MRTLIRHFQGVVHAITPNSGNRRALKNAWQPWARLPRPIVGVPPLYGVEVDNYSTNFIRAYWNPAAHAGDLFDGQYHQMKFLLKLNPPNPGGAIFADTAAIRANGGIAWFDNNGTLGKIILRQNNQPPEHEMTADEMADAIDAGAGLVVKPEGVNLIVVGIIT